MTEDEARAALIAASAILLEQEVRYFNRSAFRNDPNGDDVPEDIGCSELVVWVVRRVFGNRSEDRLRSVGLGDAEEMWNDERLPEIAQADAKQGDLVFYQHEKTHEWHVMLLDNGHVVGSCPWLKRRLDDDGRVIYYGCVVRHLFDAYERDIPWKFLRFKRSPIVELLKVPTQSTDG